MYINFYYSYCICVCVCAKCVLWWVGVVFSSIRLSTLMIFTIYLLLSTGSKQSGTSSHTPEKLRVTLVEFRALYEAAKVQLGTTKSQLSNIRQNLKQLSAECSTYREIVTSRTSAMAVSMHVCMCMYVHNVMLHTCISTCAYHKCTYIYD